MYTRVSSAAHNTRQEYLHPVHFQNQISRHIRNSHRSRRKEIRNRALELLIRSTLVDNMVLHISRVRTWLDSVPRDISNAIDKRMTGSAMVALIIILDLELPVRIHVHFPGVVEFVAAGREVEPLHSRFAVHRLELVFPFHVWLPGLEIHPDEANVVDVNMDREEGVLGFIKVGDRFEAGRFGEVPLETVGPSVVFAGED